MNKSIDQALTSLIPRHNGALPPELIELASSLLAQSRNKASNLKAEEEIGRAYACANIACERLKQSLNLPKIEPRPPCPPRIYSKLYSYLDNILVARKRGRPPKSASATTSPAKSLPSRPTPTKASSLAPFKTTPTHTPSSRKRGLQYADSTKEVVPWIHPSIRALCKELNVPAAAPHILAGVTTVLTLPSPALSTNRDEPMEDKKDKLPALIAATYFFVCTRLSGKETTGREYASQRKEVLNTLINLRENEELDEKIQKKVKEGDAWQGWEKIGTKDVDSWLMEISTRGWLKLDWFENIVEGSGLGVKDRTEEDIQDQDASQAEGLAVDKNFLQTGLGTMMQDRVDYLNERKRAEYKIWKEEIMARIQQMEAEGTVVVMDT